MLFKMPMAPSFNFDIEQLDDYVSVVLFDQKRTNTYRMAGKNFDGVCSHMLSLTETQCNDLLKGK